MDVLFSQYGLLERLRNLLEPQDYINLLRSRNNDGRHEADCTDIRYCLNPVNYLFETLDSMAAWRTMYGCSFILCGENLARLHGYLVGDVRGGDETYDLPLIIAFEDLQSYQQALADTLNGAIGDIHDEIERSVRKPIVSLSSDTQTPRETVVRLHLDLQLLDPSSLSFFGHGPCGRATPLSKSAAAGFPFLYIVGGALGELGESEFRHSEKMSCLFEKHGYIQRPAG